MPRSLSRFTLVAVALSLLVACGGPPKKPAPPPEKTSGMEVAKGTTTTDMPEADSPASPRRLTVEEVLQRPVDLVMADTAKPRLKKIIEKEVIYA